MRQSDRKRETETNNDRERERERQTDRWRQRDDSGGDSVASDTSDFCLF